MSYKRVKDLKGGMKLFGNNKKYDEASDSSFSESVSEIDIFGLDDGGNVSRKKTNPVKGFKYLFFCIFMIVVLSGMVIFKQGHHIDSNPEGDKDNNNNHSVNDHKDNSHNNPEDQDDDKEDDKNKPSKKDDDDKEKKEQDDDKEKKAKQEDKDKEDKKKK